MSTALRNFALNLPAEVDGDPYPDRRDDHLWCEECHEVTNHRDHGEREPEEC